MYHRFRCTSLVDFFQARVMRKQRPTCECSTQCVAATSEWYGRLPARSIRCACCAVFMAVLFDFNDTQGSEAAVGSYFYSSLKARTICYRGDCLSQTVRAFLNHPQVLANPRHHLWLSPNIVFGVDYSSCTRIRTV